MYSFVRIDRYVTDSAPSNWAMLGGGTRVDFRAKPSLSLTGDLTTSTLGGPFALFTGDIGARVRPQWNGHSRPYVDARVSLAYTYDSYAQLYASSIFVPPSGFNSSGRTTSTGVGALIGGGVETALSDRWGVNMGLSASHHRMLAVRVGQQRAGSSWNFNVNTVRLTFGVRYNPRRLIRE